MKEEIELTFSKKKRHIAAPDCPCGEVNSPKNPQFAPFEGHEKYGYCHRCDRKFFPEQDQTEFKIKFPEKVPQKFITTEPVFNWVIPDAVVENIPKDKILKGHHWITWYYRNFQGQLTGAKKMLYNFTEDGFKRVHEQIPLHLYTRDSGYYPCLFYERDLHLYPQAKVVLVEAEKTAALMRKIMKDHLKEFIFIAVSGSNGLTDEKAKILAGREILICYDCDNGEPQPDGTIKSPKGREGALSAHTKLAGIANSIIVDIAPDKHNGTDLADMEVNYDFIKNLKGERKYPQELINDIRQLNITGEKWTKDQADRLGALHLVGHQQVFDIGRLYYQTNVHEFGIESAPLLKKIEHFLLERFEFRRNSITGQIVYRDKSKDNSFSSCNYNDLWRLLQHNLSRFKAKPKDIGISSVSNLLESDFVPEINPFEDYLHNLPHWDGVDWIEKLGNYVKCSDQQFWLDQFKKALVRMIACSYGHIENRIIMVLVGPSQEIGKDNFLRFLCPPDLKEYYKEDPMVLNKDAEIALCQNFMWNLTELDQLNNKEISEIKGIISRAKVKQRKSYGRKEEIMTRTVSFWGSTNKEEFLTDTQNTRWLCFRVDLIDYKYNDYINDIREISIQKVWAQAWYLYKTGFMFNMDKDERKKRDILNHSFEKMTQEKQLILKYLTPCKKESPNAEFIMTVEIQEYLISQTDNKIKIVNENIGRSMIQLDFEPGTKKIQGKTVRGYYALRQPLLKNKPTPQVSSPEIFDDVTPKEEIAETPF